MLLSDSTHYFIWIKGYSSPQMHSLDQESSFSTNFALHKINDITLVSLNLLIVQWKEHLCLEKGRWRVIEPLSSATERVVLGNTQLRVFSGHRRGEKKKRDESLCSYFVDNMQQRKFWPDIQNIFLTGLVSTEGCPWTCEISTLGGDIQRLIGQVPEKHNKAWKLILFELWIGLGDFQWSLQPELFCDSVIHNPG